MILEFEGGIIDGESHGMSDECAIEPILMFRFGTSDKVYEYRLIDSVIDEYSLEKKYRFRFHQVLTG